VTQLVTRRWRNVDGSRHGSSAVFLHLSDFRNRNTRLSRVRRGVNNRKETCPEKRHMDFAHPPHLLRNDGSTVNGKSKMLDLADSYVSVQGGQYRACQR